MSKAAIERLQPPPKCIPRVRPYPRTILSVAILLRLLVVWMVVARYPPDWLYGRGIELGLLAQSLSAGRGLSSPFGGSTGPTALLAPGYPAFIAVFFHVFGAFTVSTAIAVMASQLLFNAVTVWLIMHLARELFSVQAANLSGIFWAVSPPLIWMPTIFWESCLSTMLLVGMAALALRCQRAPDTRLWALTGGYCGMAALVNPALLPALLMMMGWAAWRQPKALCCLPVALLVLTTIYAPWPIRNARVLHAFIPLRSTVGLELWMGNHAGASGFLDESRFPIFNRWEYDQYAEKGEVAYMRERSALAKAYIRSHPSAFLRLSAVRFFRFWTGTGNKDGSVIFSLHAVLTTSLGFTGIWRLTRQGRLRVAMLFLLPLMVFPLPYYITHAEFRYRLVIDPLLTILAAYALTSARDGAEKR